MELRQNKVLDSFVDVSLCVAFFQGDGALTA